MTNPSNEILNRISIQTLLSDSLSSFPKIYYEWENNTIFQNIEWVFQKPWPKSKTTLKHLFSMLYEDILTMHDNGYIHGDILTKNIVFNGERFILIDHEIILYHDSILKVTYPWVDLDDFLSSKISQKTDLICFYATYLRWTNPISYIKYRKSREELLYNCYFTIK